MSRPSYEDYRNSDEAQALYEAGESYVRERIWEDVDITKCRVTQWGVIAKTNQGECFEIEAETLGFTSWMNQEPD